MYKGAGEMWEDEVFQMALESADLGSCARLFKDAQRYGNSMAMARAMAWWIWCRHQKETSFEEWSWYLGEDRSWLRAHYDPRILNAIHHWIHSLSGYIHFSGPEQKIPQPYSEFPFPRMRGRGGVSALDESNFWECVNAGRALWEDFARHSYTLSQNDLMAVHASVFVLGADGRMLPGMNFPAPRVGE